ncbi:MAG TPA: iron-sulfur cluster insertion protein ErpA [Thermodesulfobacteriota bacterium]|nr:iron-sulfur cluster insertion protein ErpA [Thermodesulfobacteriota bacterium]
MVTLTSRAADKVREFLAEQNKPHFGLRMAVIGGGCSGFQYDLGIDEKPAEDDHVFESHGIKIFIDPLSAQYLEGTELDYVETMAGSGFRFNNPNAKRSCGCGSSFTA